MAGWHIGVIGDPDLGRQAGLDDEQQIAVASAFGEPSDAVTMGSLGGVRFTVLARHGATGGLSAPAVNYRANLDVLKRCGVTDVLALDMVASLRPDIAPGDLVVADQFIDQTQGRARSFFGPGIAAHVDLADPVCARLAPLVAGAAEAAAARSAARVHRAGCYLAFEGPQSPTRAEAALYRQWGADVAGMAAMPEARLAREAELPYVLLGCVVPGVSERAGGGQGDTIAEILRHLVSRLPEAREPSPIDRALDDAIATPLEDWDRAAAMRLDAIAARYLRGHRPD